MQYCEQIEKNGEEENLTKYGLLRYTFLKEHHRGIYTAKLLKGTITMHCLEIQEGAEQYAGSLIKRMMETEGVSEELKAMDQMEWVGRMNSIRNRVDELVLHEIVYQI